MDLINKDSRFNAYWMLSTTAFFLACNHVIGRSIEGVIPPVGLSFWRWGVGAIILLPFVAMRLKGSWPYYRQKPSVLIALSTMMVGSTTLVLVALNYTTALNASLINALQPTMTAFLTMIFLKEQLNRVQWLGIFLGFVGVLVMVTKANWQILVKLQFNAGDLLVLVAVCGFSGYSLLLRSLPPQLNGSEKLFSIAITGVVLLSPFYLWESASVAPVTLTSHTLTVVIVLALLVTVVGNAMWNRGIMIIGPSKAAMFINLIPLFGAILAVTWLGEVIELYHLAGAIMVCTGIVCVIRKNNQ